MWSVDYLWHGIQHSWYQFCSLIIYGIGKQHWRYQCGSLIIFDMVYCTHDINVVRWLSMAWYTALMISMWFPCHNNCSAYSACVRFSSYSITESDLSKKSCFHAIIWYNCSYMKTIYHLGIIRIRYLNNKANCISSFNFQSRINSDLSRIRYGFLFAVFPKYIQSTSIWK